MPRGFQDASFFGSILVSISNAFWLRFGSQLASNLGPKTRRDGARSRPGGVQNRGKKELPSQDAPESDLDAILDGFWDRFGRIFDGFSMNFGSNFGSKNLFTCPLDFSYSEGERSERASAASDVSGAMELQRLGVTVVSSSG